jgi:DoxX-like protein
MSVNVASAEAGAAWESKPSIRWAGRILTAIPILLMLFSASMKLAGSSQMLEEFVNRFGYSASVAPILGAVELTCVVLYAIPRTGILGAILLTGYLGGAIATHVRIGDPSFVIPFALGVVAWAGIYLREARLHALLPLRRVTAPR